MSDSNSPNTAQKARLLVDGNDPDPSAIITVSPDGIAHVDVSAAPQIFIVADAAGDATIDVHQLGREGTDDISVADAPLAISLDVPEPK